MPVSGKESVALSPQGGGSDKVRPGQTGAARRPMPGESPIKQSRKAAQEKTGGDERSGCVPGVFEASSKTRRTKNANTDVDALAVAA
jgi:hypothetical protein